MRPEWTHVMQELTVCRSLRAEVRLDCPDETGWRRAEFLADPVDLETAVYSFACPVCGEGLVWDGRQVREDLGALSRRLEATGEGNV